MNNNLIITHKDGRTWNEGQLGSLLRDEFGAILDEEKDAPPSLHYRSIVGWHVQHNFGISPPDEYGNIYHTGGTFHPLDPSLYTVSPVGVIAVEKVREMIEGVDNMFIHGELYHSVPMETEMCQCGQSWTECRDTLNRLASKYLGEEN